MKFYHATTNEAAASIQKVSVFEVNLKRSEVTESHDHSERFFQCKAYTHDGDIAVSDRVPVRTYDFQNLVKGV